MQQVGRHSLCRQASQHAQAVVAVAGNQAVEVAQVQQGGRLGQQGGIPVGQDKNCMLPSIQVAVMCAQPAINCCPVQPALPAHSPLSQCLRNVQSAGLG